MAQRLSDAQEDANATHLWRFHRRLQSLGKVHDISGDACKARVLVRYESQHQTRGYTAASAKKTLVINLNAAEQGRLRLDRSAGLTSKVPISYSTRFQTFSTLSDGSLQIEGLDYVTRERGSFDSFKVVLSPL